MVKNILTYLIVFFVVGLAVLCIQLQLSDSLATEMILVVKQSYGFHFVFSILICVVFKIGSKIPKYQNQLGFIYLGSFVLKLIVYCGVFNAVVFNSAALTKMQSFSLLVPVFVFLAIEVYFISKILNSN